MPREILLLLVCYTFMSELTQTQCIQINYVKVPFAIKNNSGNPAILDCNYSVRPDDTDLVVKWLLNEEVVYQWIPPQKPQSLGRMKNKIDLTYRVSDDPKTAHRALKIMNPLSEDAGEYKCFVSTFADEDFSFKKMIVFEPEKELVILNSTDRNNINFTCLATDVYPAPKLTIYQDKKEVESFLLQTPLQTIKWDTTKNKNGKFSTFLVATSSLSSLESGTLIHCELRIPGTGYVKKKSLLFFPDDYGKNCGCAKIHPGVLTGILMLLLCGYIFFNIN